MRSMDCRSEDEESTIEYAEETIGSEKLEETPDTDITESDSEFYFDKIIN